MAIPENNINKRGIDLATVTMPFECRKIMMVLPQRYPMLLVDKVISVSMNELVAIKAATIGELALDGHFPGRPVTPGVTMIEFNAQAATLLAYFRDMHPLAENVKVGVRMVGLDDVHLRMEVLPGDIIVTTVKHLNSKAVGKSVFHKFHTVGKVNNKIAIEAQMTGYFFNELDQQVTLDDGGINGDAFATINPKK